MKTKRAGRFLRNNSMVGSIRQIHVSEEYVNGSNRNSCLLDCTFPLQIPGSDATSTSPSESGRPSGLQVYYKENTTQVFSCEYCEIFKNTYFEEQFRTGA